MLWAVTIGCYLTDYEKRDMDESSDEYDEYDYDDEKIVKKCLTAEEKRRRKKEAMKKPSAPLAKDVDRKTLAKKALYNIETANREYLGLPPKKKGVGEGGANIESKVCCPLYVVHRE